MTEDYSYKGAFREGVTFLFYSLETNEVLAELRPNENGKIDMFFPNGSVELKDHAGREDYRLTALKREIDEEFQGEVASTKFYYLGETYIEVIQVVFYNYLITNWHGEIPSYTIEDGKKHSKLKWIKLDEYKKHFEFESAIEICEKIADFVKTLDSGSK